MLTLFLLDFTPLDKVVFKSVHDQLLILTIHNVDYVLLSVLYDSLSQREEMLVILASGTSSEELLHYVCSPVLTLWLTQEV